MPRQSKKKARAAKKPAPRPLISPAMARHLGLGTLWIASLVAIPYGLSALDGYAAERSPYRETEAYPTRIEWMNLPGWLSETPYARVRGEILNQIALDPNADANWGELCAWVHHRAEASPWIARVRRVSKRADNIVLVDADFRKPLTYLFVGSNAYLVDQDGFQLWPALPQNSVDPRWLPVRGTRSGPPGAGRQWEGEDRAAGLALVRLLNEAEVRGSLTFMHQLEAVDVSNYRSDANGVLRIETVNPDVKIIWGKAPSREYDTECPAGQKVARLQRILSERDGSPAPGTYDLRPMAEIWYSAAGT